MFQQNRVHQIWERKVNYYEKKTLPSLVHLSYLSAISVFYLLLFVISILEMIFLILKLQFIGAQLLLPSTHALTLLFSFGKDHY